MTRLEVGGERRAREDREWERGKFYMYIIVYYTYTFVYRASKTKGGESGTEVNFICIYVK